MQLNLSVAQEYSVLTAQVNHNMPAPTSEQLLDAFQAVSAQINQAVCAGSNVVTISCSTSGRMIHDLTKVLEKMGFTVFHTFIAGEAPYFRLQINW